MTVFWTVLGILAFLLVAVLVISYICFKIAFLASEEDTEEEFSLPPGKIYEPYRDIMVDWMKEARKMPHKEYSVISFDGLKLCAKYYECKKGAPIELMFHGYRGLAERDLCGGIQRCFKLGRNAFIVDQRACGNSEGKVITFGINERRDVLTWVDFVINTFGNDVKIIITGISMGAATVVMASSMDLPKNVIGALADCGYTSAKDIIQKTVREMHLPPKASYPFVKLGAKIFGHFDVDETSPIEAAKNCRIPIIFIHGEGDDFVPCYMSEEVYKACTAKKTLFTVPGAGHGLAYLVRPEEYINTLKNFNYEE